MPTLPYDLALEDTTIFESSVACEFTDAICASFVGGPPGVVSGKVWVTGTELAFRPEAGQPHPQVLTVQRERLGPPRAVQRRWLGLIARGAPWVELALHGMGRELALAFQLPEPSAFLRALSTELQPLRGARERLEAALREGLNHSARYTSTLADLAFPQGFWHVGASEDLTGVVSHCWEQLGVPLGAALLHDLDLDVEVLMGPEDCETGPGSECWARREQIQRICDAANQALTGPRRFYAFAEDLPDWEYDEPLWLWLTEEERTRLLELGVLRPAQPRASS